MKKVQLLRQRYNNTLWQLGIDNAIAEGNVELLLLQLQGQYEDSPETMFKILPRDVCKQLFKNKKP